jgi:hypothetical protein
MHEPTMAHASPRGDFSDNRRRRRDSAESRSCDAATVGGMAIRKSVGPGPEHLDADELISRRREDALVLLPDTLSPIDGQMVAGFREGAQALRVRAKQEGVPVEIVVPKGAQPGHYSEHAAEWVLPLILGVPVAAVAQLIANEIQRWIDEWRAHGRSHTPILRYRELVVDEATRTTSVRELEGPADEVADWIAQRPALSAGTEPEGDEWQWPESE